MSSAWGTWPKAVVSLIEDTWARNAEAASNMDKVGSGTLARTIREKHRISVSNATLDRYAKHRGRKSWSVP
jgi:hypothetical protein